MPGLFLVLLSVCLVCVCFVLFLTYGKRQVIIFLRAEEKMGGEKKPKKTPTKSTKSVTGRKAFSCPSSP